MIAKELENILRNGRGEREVSKFLAKHPGIVRWAVCNTGGHSAYVLKEFQLGSHFKADFVVPYSYSGCWEVHFIELEPPEDHVINKDGTVSQRLNKALAQICEWNDYILNNQIQIRQDLARQSMKKDLLKWMPKGQRPTNYTTDYLDDPATYIRYYYHIAIGNRWNVSKEQRKRMNQQVNQHAYHIFTYGRFLDIAKNFDRYEFLKGEGSVCLTDSEE